MKHPLGSLACFAGGASRQPLRRGWPTEPTPTARSTDPVPSGGPGVPIPDGGRGLWSRRRGRAARAEAVVAIRMTKVLAGETRDLSAR
jgi:hypothetical protein